MRALTGSRRVDVPYLQLFATKLHHCPGLISYLNGRIKGADIDLEECVPRTVRIPPQQRARLGGPSSSLGDTAMLGHKALDLTGKFRIKAKAASLEELESLMPGGANRAIIEESVSRYVDSPLVYDIKINLPQGAIKGFTLGSSERALGVSTFVSPSEGSTKEIISPVKSRLRPLFQASAAASAAAGGTSR
jgi:type VI secretion system protein ImpH